MTPNEKEQYRWLDAEELKPRKSDDNQQSKLMSKLLELLVSDSI